MASQASALINLIALTVRGGRGCMVINRGAEKPQRMLKLYDLEVSPYCRLVRETLTELDIDYLVLPCPKGGRRFRQEAEAIGGKQQFPLLIDDNTGKILYESADIIDYLVSTYAKKPERFGRLPRQIEVFTSLLASVLMYRPGGLTGLKASASRAPEKPLVLYSFEGSPYSKIVRARLCELELPYIIRNTGKGAKTDIGPPMFRDRLFKGPMGTTPHRTWLAEQTGQVQVPYLVDENTGVAMYESADIVAYLNKTYAL